MKTNHNNLQSSFFRKPFLGVILIFSLLSLLNIPILVTLSRHSFDDGTYSHAYLIPFITLFLYFKLVEIGKLVYRTEISILYSFIFIISCSLLYIATTAQISIGYWLSFLAVSISSICMLYRFNWYIIFPALFLIFIFPFWGLLTPLLQSISVSAVTYMMSFTGVPTFVEAQFVTIPAGVFEIADGCSGLRYIIVSLAISSLFIFLYIDNAKQAIKFLLIAILGALLTNWVRITALILIGEYTNMESSLMKDHNTFGWYLYIPFMFLLFYWGNKLSNFDLVNTKISDYELNTQNFPNIKSVSIFALFLLLSSATIHSYSGLFSLNNATKIAKDTQLQPEIYYYTEVENITSQQPRQDSLYNIYYFNGDDLDGKPTFYNNELIPSGWKILEKTTSKSEQNFLITSNMKKAILSISFEIGNKRYSSNRAFKIARLKSALKGIKESKLHWNLRYCQAQCNLNEF